MKEEFKGAGASDFKQRYQGTYGWYVKSDKSLHLVKLSSIGERACTGVDAAGMEYRFVADAGNEFSFLPVEKGLYLVDDEVILVTRKPARQWKRGLCSENTVFTNLSTGRNQAVDFRTVASIFTKDVKAPEYKAGTDIVFRNYAAFVKDKVYVLELEVGTIKDKVITMSNGYFTQELSDIIRDFKLPLTIQ